VQHNAWQSKGYLNFLKINIILKIQNKITAKNILKDINILDRQIVKQPKKNQDSSIDLR
jgi:hypothetical protein